MKQFQVTSTASNGYEVKLTFKADDLKTAVYIANKMIVDKYNLVVEEIQGGKGL